MSPPPISGTIDPAALAERLESNGVRWICSSMVDMGGVTRVKCMPARKLAAAAREGTGAPASWVAAQANGEFAMPESAGGSVGDLRLMPDLEALTESDATPGWAWVPSDQYTQEGEPHPTCQRTFLKRVVGRAGDAGLTAVMAFEFEWFTALGTDPIVPYHEGPSFSANALARTLPMVEGLLSALDRQGVPVGASTPSARPASSRSP